MEIEKRNIPEKYRLELMVAIMYASGSEPDFDSDRYLHNEHDNRQNLVTGLSGYFCRHKGYPAFSTVNLAWLDSPSKTIEHMTRHLDQV